METVADALKAEWTVIVVHYRLPGNSGWLRIKLETRAKNDSLDEIANLLMAATSGAIGVSLWRFRENAYPTYEEQMLIGKRLV